MDVVRALRAEAAQIHRGHAPVRKGDAVAGVNVQLCLAGHAQLLHQPVHVADRRLRGQHRGHVLAQGGRGHVQVDHQHVPVQLVCVGGHPGLGAQQPLLLRAVPVELHGAAGRMGCEVPRQLQDDDAAGHVVVHAGGEVHAVVMRAEGDDFLRLLPALDDRAHVMAHAVVVLARQLNADGLCPAAHHFRRVRRPHVQRGNGPEIVREGLPQLADVAVRFIPAVDGRAGEGQHRRRPGLAQLLVVLAAQPAVDQHRAALHLGKMHIGDVLGIIKGKLHAACGGGGRPLVAGDLEFLAEGLGHGEPGVADPAALDGEFLQMGLKPGSLRFRQKPFGGPALRLRAADALKGQLLHQSEGAMGRYVHDAFPPCVSVGSAMKIRGCCLFSFQNEYTKSSRRAAAMFTGTCYNP